MKAFSPNFLVIVLVLLIFPLISSRLKKEKGTENSPIPAISKVWVIHRHRRSNRLQAVLARLDELRIPYHRSPGIDFGNGDPGLIKLARKKLHPETKLNAELLVESALEKSETSSTNWGSAALWQSHLQIHLNIVNGTGSSLFGPFVVFADDVNVSSRAIDALSWDFLYKYLPYEWDILFLNHKFLKCHNDEKMFLPPRDPSLYYCMVKHNSEFNSYVIRSRGIAQLLVDEGNSEFMQVLEFYMNKLFETKKLKAFAILQRPVTNLKGIHGYNNHLPKVKLHPNRGIHHHLDEE